MYVSSSRSRFLTWWVFAFGKLQLLSVQMEQLHVDKRNGLRISTLTTKVSDAG